MVVWLCAGDSQRGSARGLLSRAAAAHLGVAEAAVTVGRAEGGGPVLGGAAEGLHAALAHTRSGVVAAGLCERGPIGVDVEPLRPLPVAGLAARWFAEAETAWLAEQPADARSAAFLLLWTQKEAVGKALGTGLRGRGLRREVPRLAAADDVPALRPVPELAPLRVAAWRQRPDLIVAVAGHGEAVVVHDLAG